MATPVKRQYADLAGVDFKNEESLVQLNRSPDALNVYRDYENEGNCIRTRPGYRELGQFEDKINGMYIYNTTTTLVHAGTKLYLWDNFPSIPENPTVLFDSMNNEDSCFFIFEDKLYINDGLNYLVYDGELKNVSDIAFIPTTTIGRSPSGGGTMYQDVNVLQAKRINMFVADGMSKDYYLDVTEIDSVDEVYVNDVLITDYTISKALGRVTFNTAPEKSTLGIDNVKIVFSKTATGYIDRISKCNISQVFDNRVFFTGNIAYKNTLFHSELNNPAYISDLSYYQDGTSESAIKDIAVGNNILWVFKEPNQENATVFYHVPSTSQEYGRIYTSKQGNVSIGCYASGINFNDDKVFLSKYGLEGITGDILDEQLLSHRSSLIDNKLINANNFNKAKMYEWKGYLLVLVDKYIFLADSRQKFQGINGIEYEWYLWDIEQSNPNILKEYKGELYIGSTDGKIYMLGGTNDNGNVINSYWTTPMDAFGYSNMLKTTNKRGGLARIKTIPNGKIKISERTNKAEEKFITSKPATGFDYANVDYDNFAYTTKTDSYIVYKIKEKKFLNISLKFYSDELDKPFGLYSAILEAFIGGYAKR
jgi:hypothetical protein